MEITSLIWMSVVAAVVFVIAMPSQTWEFFVNSRLRRIAPDRIRAAASLTDAELAKVTDRELQRYFQAHSYVRRVYRGGVLGEDPALKALYARLDAEDERRKAAKTAAEEAVRAAAAESARQSLGLAQNDSSAL